jgi:hypothetical protein
MATAVTTIEVPMERSSGHHRSSTYALICVAQPKGENQDRVPFPRSPMARAR